MVFAAIPYTTRMFYGNLLETCSDITSNREVEQSVEDEGPVEYAVELTSYHHADVWRLYTQRS